MLVSNENYLFGRIFEIIFFLGFGHGKVSHTIIFYGTLKKEPKVNIRDSVSWHAWMINGHFCMEKYFY